MSISTSLRHVGNVNKYCTTVFFAQETVHFNSRKFTKNFQCLGNIKCYSVHSVRQTEFLRFMNISKCFNLKSFGTMRLPFLGSEGLKDFPLYGACIC